MDAEKAAQLATSKIDKLTQDWVEVLGQVELDLVARLSQFAGTEVIDAVEAKLAVDRILNESGLIQVRDQVLNQTYQELAQIAQDQYADILDDVLIFSPDTLDSLNSMRGLNFQEFNQITDAASQEITRLFINQQFGAISKAQMIGQIKGLVEKHVGRYAYTWVNTSIQNFYNLSNTRLAQDNGIELFTYVGPIDGKTRDFGRLYIGKTMTIKQWDALASDPVVQSVRGNQPLPISVWLTGWNHRGHLVGRVA